MIFYTSIHTNRPAETYAEQWAALGDKELLNWQKHPSNPILHERLHGGAKIYDWRDPFIFAHKGATYMVLGGNLNERKGGQAVVTIYRAENEALTQWNYLGVLFTHPNPNVVNIECPNFFKLGEKWVLIVSPHGPVEYFVGDFNPVTAKFVPQQTGILDDGGNLYAPNSMQDSHGRRVLWGWIKGFEPGRGWNGALTLPRILSLGPGNQLEQRPAHELRKLRADHFRMSDFTLNGRANPVAGLTGDCLELYVELELLHSAAVQLQVRRSQDGARFIPITFDGGQLIVAGTKAPLELLPGERTLKLNVFLDKSVMELFVNDRACYTRVIQPNSEDIGVALGASAGTARIRSFHAWKMRSIW